MDEIKYADLAELHRIGILQEANRLFFHPLGLAMEWRLPHPNSPKDDTKPEIVGIWDYREDPEGVIFTDLSGQEAEEKYAKTAELRAKHSVKRAEMFGGGIIQPIGDKR